MTSLSHSNQDRFLELLADEAAFGLDEAGQRDLGELLRQSEDPTTTLESFEIAAAACDLAFQPAALEPLPAHLRERVLAGSEGSGSSLSPVAGRISAERTPAISPKLSIASGWLAAAACLTLAVIAWWPSGTVSPRIERQQLIAHASDELQWGWAALGEFEGRAIGGDVVWSTNEQEGYMRFSGMPANDPSVEQYQLWIFDPSQPEATPIDGGVFNVEASGEVVVPINEKLAPTGPTLFAVTIEKPGGVVVSDRSRLVLVAQAPEQG